MTTFGYTYREGWGMWISPDGLHRVHDLRDLDNRLERIFNCDGKGPCRCVREKEYRIKE